VTASPVRALVEGFAQLLADAGVGVWSPDDPYGADDIAIVYGTERPISNQQVILNWVDLDQHPEITQGSGLLQVTVKGLPNDRGSTDDLSYAAFAVLHGLTDRSLGPALVVQCLRRNSTPMGQDDKLRVERADHYDVDVEWPPTIHRS
jgi:hypothetical protein